MLSISGNPVFYELEEEMTLVSAFAFGQALLSDDPQLTFASWVASLADGATDKFLLFLQADINNKTAVQLQALNFKFLAGARLYFAPVAASIAGYLLFSTAEDGITLI